MKNLNTQEGLNWLLGKIKSNMSGKVDKIRGKGLSTNDYTDEDKTKLNSVSTITFAEIDNLFYERN